MRASEPWYAVVRTVEASWYSRGSDGKCTDGDIWIAILALCMSASGRESTSSGRLKQSSLKLNLERIWSWSITERRPDGLLKRPDGCNAGTIASWYSKGPDGKCTSSGWVMLGLSSVQTDGTVDRWHDRSDGWQGTGDYLSCRQNLLKLYWIAESLVKQHLLHTSNFVQTEWGQ
jgi:hypothetical protein